MDAITSNPEDEIRQRAFSIWEERGNPEGYETEFWLTAERELKREEQPSSDGLIVPSARSGGGSDGRY